MTITLGDISVRYVNLMLKTATAQGINSETVKAQFELPDSHLASPAGRISIPKFMRLGHELMHTLKRPDFGLMMANHATLPLLGLSGLCASCAPTLKQTLYDIAHYEPLSIKNARGHSRVYSENKTIVAELYSLSPYNAFNYFIVDLALAVDYALINMLTYDTLTPVLVQIEFPAPSYADQYQHYFPCPVRFNQPRNALIFRDTDLNKPPIFTNPVTYAECKAICEQQLTITQSNLSFQDRVMQQISSLLHSPELNMEQVAKRLEMPVWTLRRKLKQENTGFTELLENTRKALAYIYLKDRHYTINEVSYLLGFTYPNAFQRAFKRWSGLPPGEYRAKALTNKPSA